MPGLVRLIADALEHALPDVAEAGTAIPALLIAAVLDRDLPQDHLSNMDFGLILADIKSASEALTALIGFGLLARGLLKKPLMLRFC